MEFKPGNPERRGDRRICPKCESHCASRRTCNRCATETKPRIRIVWTIQGKRYRKLTNCWREADAREVLRSIEEDYWRQQRLGVSRDVGGTIGEAIAAFEKSREGQSDDWRSQIRTALNPLCEGLGADTEITLVTKEDIQQYLDDGLTSRSPTTMRSYMLVVRCMFNWLEDEGWIRINPARRIKLPKAKTRFADCLMPDQVRPVLKACFEVQPDFGPVAMAIALGSFRKGEIVNLRRAGVDLATRWAQVTDFEGDEQAGAWTPKTDSSRRVIPLHPQLAWVLERVSAVERPDGSPSPWMFPVSDPRRRSRFRDKAGRLQLAVGDRRAPSTNYYGGCLRKALEKVGIERPVTIHGLRRTFAVLLQQAGAPDSIIRQAMGHAPRGVTERHYLPRRDELVQQWVDRIDIGEIAAEVAPYLPPVGDFSGADQPQGLHLMVPAPEILQ
jgi:integrase